MWIEWLKVCAILSSVFRIAFQKGNHLPQDQNLAKTEAAEGWGPIRPCRTHQATFKGVTDTLLGYAVCLAFGPGPV